jgi:signal transduction histidine kinase
LLPDEADDAVPAPEPIAPAEALAETALPAPIIGALAIDPPTRTSAEPERIREDDPGLRRLANALIHQVRNPLATIRTFADLLPERFDDPDFRARFPEMVRDGRRPDSTGCSRASSSSRRSTRRAATRSTCAR